MKINKVIDPLVFVAYLLTIPFANWLIGNVGSVEFPGGPHMIPVGFGYQAPSGVLAIGVALAARDYVQARYGKLVTLFAIGIGIVLSYFVDPAVATASAVAFALGELADFAVYTQIRKKTLVGAVVASGVIGGAIDSFVFLRIAFGSIDYWQGQVIGKAGMALLGGCMIGVFNAVSVRMRTRKASSASVVG